MAHRATAQTRTATPGLRDRAIHAVACLGPYAVADMDADRTESGGRRDQGAAYRQCGGDRERARAKAEPEVSDFPGVELEQRGRTGIPAVEVRSVQGHGRP